MNDEKRKNLQALKESIEILKEYSESPLEQQMLNDLVDDEGFDNRVDDDLMKKLIHNNYNSFDKEKSDEGIVR
jgi:hypothetical protein